MGAARRLRKRLKATNDSWRVDETYVRVKGEWRYLHRAVDSNGATLDLLLSAQQNADAAKRFLAKSLGRENHPEPRVIHTDGHGARPHVDAGCVRVGNGEFGPLRVALALRAGATAGLALRSGAGRIGSFGASGGLAGRGPGRRSFLVTAAHRLPGDRLFTLLSGLRPAASRRPLTTNVIAFREEPCFQSGPGNSRSRTSVVSAFCFRCPFRQPTPSRAEWPSASFFSTVTRASSVRNLQEARLYLGVNGERPWKDAAAARTTPVRLGLYALAALIAQRQPDWQQAFRRSAWYKKARPTGADAMAQVGRALWQQLGFWLSEAVLEKQKAAPVRFEHVAELLAYVT